MRGWTLDDARYQLSAGSDSPSSISFFGKLFKETITLGVMCCVRRYRCEEKPCHLCSQSEMTSLVQGNHKPSLALHLDKHVGYEPLGLC